MPGHLTISVKDDERTKTIWNLKSKSGTPFSTEFMKLYNNLDPNIQKNSSFKSLTANSTTTDRYGRHNLSVLIRIAEDLQNPALQQGLQKLLSDFGIGYGRRENKQLEIFLKDDAHVDPHAGLPQQQENPSLLVDANIVVEAEEKGKATPPPAQSDPTLEEAKEIIKILQEELEKKEKEAKEPPSTKKPTKEEQERIDERLKVDDPEEVKQAQGIVSSVFGAVKGMFKKGGASGSTPSSPLSPTKAPSPPPPPPPKGTSPAPPPTTTIPTAPGASVGTTGAISSTPSVKAPTSTPATSSSIPASVALRFDEPYDLDKQEMRLMGRPKMYNKEAFKLPRGIKEELALCRDNMKAYKADIRQPSCDRKDYRGIFY